MTKQQPTNSNASLNYASMRPVQNKFKKHKLKKIQRVNHKSKAISSSNNFNFWEMEEEIKKLISVQNSNYDKLTAESCNNEQMKP